MTGASALDFLGGQWQCTGAMPLHQAGGDVGPGQEVIDSDAEPSDWLDHGAHVAHVCSIVDASGARLGCVNSGAG
jgi:hypothetical protein